jgi:hypothetical protein
MAESFLAEQLRRIREMTEQMSRLRNHAAELEDEHRAEELEDELARDPNPGSTPVHEVRDAPHTPSPKHSSGTAHGTPRRAVAHAPRRRAR